MTTFCVPRRLILFGAMGALVAGCARSGASPDANPQLASDMADTPLSVDFAYPDGQTVRLDYLDQKNFRFVASGQSRETMAIDGNIYLHILPEGDQAEKLWRYGALANGAHARLTSLPKTRPTLIPLAGIAHWGIKSDVYDVTTSAEGSPTLQLEATIAKLPALARAQWIVATSLLPAMDMSVCGDGVQLLTRSWNADITGQGWAVLATTDGFRLDGPVGNLSATPSLPPGIAIGELPTL